MKQIKCLIVDDEPLARKAVRQCIALHPDLVVIGEAGDGERALSFLEKQHPDLVFLDVQMPEMGGFELLQALESKRLRAPVVIFVTAYDKYALQAFEAQALDYLLKPIDAKRFAKAVATAKSRLVEREAPSASELLEKLAEQGLFQRPNARIAVKSKGSRIFFVRLDEIHWIEAQGNYVRLHLADESHLLRETMNSFEQKLDKTKFMRIHRSAIVNVDHVANIEPWFTGEYIVHLHSGKELTLTRYYRENLKRMISGIDDEKDAG